MKGYRVPITARLEGAGIAAAAKGRLILIGKKVGILSSQTGGGLQRLQPVFKRFDPGLRFRIADLHLLQLLPKILPHG
ncbi:hypothetical protein DF286_04000 [Sphingosinicella humi]|uniref:Uncharacterized protein n=1 Tax=Allosphingosinicella humi TaxID=2068657 RepID=A0A2U2J1B7_9SPHN|nr:hypothetical protein DF286_04000 [Sphingosinicella humi]